MQKILEKYGLTGAAMNGFIARDVSRLDMLGADVIRLEHERTGAQIMLIENEDINRAFELSFRTPAVDNTGVPHVFEHSTLDGSKKYPSKQLWFNTNYQTYNTYMNAGTLNYMTTYPVASLSEKQLLALADFYADSCFNPMIYEDESIFREEAWRYAMDDPNGELTLAGTVYSEMRGAYTLRFASELNFIRTLFPGSVRGNNHGGTPSDIPSMTWADLKAYHDVYYHPSNAMICIYGKIEAPEAFLKLLDDCFAAYERREAAPSDENYRPITSAVRAEFEFPLAADADTEKGSVIGYGFACGGMTEEDALRLDMLSDLLDDPSSAFHQKVREALPYASAGCYADFSTPEPAIFFSADNVNPEDADVFKRAVDEAMAETARSGFAPETVEAVAASKRLSLLLSGESDTVGVDLSMMFAMLWTCFDDPHGYEKYISMHDQYVPLAESGAFADLLRRCVTENPRSAIAVTKPVAGLKEKEDAALAEKLAGIRADMTDAERAAIAASDEEEEDDCAGYLRKLKAVSVPELPEEARVYEISDETGKDSVRRIDVRANAKGVGTALMLLDARGIPQENLHDFKLYAALIGELDTLRRTRAQVSARITRYLFGQTIRVSAFGSGDELNPRLRGSFTALDEDMESAYDLLYELFFETKLDDAAAIKGLIAAEKSRLRRSISQNPLSMLFFRSYAETCASAAYFSHVSFLDYYDYLCRAEEKMDEDPEAVLGGLRNVQKLLNTRANAIVGFVGSEESAANHRAAADKFLSRLNGNPAARQEYAFAPAARKEAFVIDNAVQFNVRFAPFASLGIDEYADALAVLNTLLTDLYMMPGLRDRYGAYGAYASAQAQYGEQLFTYRDPNIAETAAVMNALPEEIGRLLKDVDQEKLDGYIMSAYSKLAKSTGELSGGLDAILDRLNGLGRLEKPERLRRLKALTPQVLAGYAEKIARVSKEGSFRTAGSAASIDAAANLYEEIFRPFSAE